MVAGSPPPPESKRKMKTQIIALALALLLSSCSPDTAGGRVDAQAIKVQTVDIQLDGKFFIDSCTRQGNVLRCAVHLAEANSGDPFAEYALEGWRISGMA